VGEIEAPVISIEKGVIFNGNCAMKAKTISSSKRDDKPKEIFAKGDIKEK
jgi:cytoskeletal protein CcmA (bactofilin family)